MRTGISILILLAFWVRAYTQIPYHTAKGIRENCVIVTGNTFTFKTDETSVELLSAYLKSYLSEEMAGSPMLTGQVFDHFMDNPFFGEQLRPIPGGSFDFLSQAIRQAPSSLGGIAIPNEILLGVTDWIIKRTKQELSIYFFENFKKQIKKYPDLRTVFPQTYRSLIILDEEIYNFQRYLKILRTSFQQDIGQLTLHLPTIIDNHPEFFNQHPDLKATLNSGFYLARSLEEEVHPGEILQEYPVDYLEPLSPNWKGAIQTLQLVSGSLRNTVDPTQTDTSYWVTSSLARNLVKDRIAFRIYLGLLYQQAKTNYGGITLKTARGDTTLTGIFRTMAPAYDSVFSSYALFISTFSQKTEKLNKYVSENKISGIDSTSFQDYFNYTYATLDLLQHCTHLSKLPFIRELVPDLADTLKNYFDVTRSSMDLFLNIRMKNFSSAVANAVNIYDLVIGAQAQADSENLTFEEPYRISVGSVHSAKRNLLRYGTFLASIAEAETPEEVEKVIETFALPPGSSRVKRQSLFNVSLNVYSGLFLGNEVIHDVDPDRPFSGINSYGLAVPIGFSISKGYRYLPWPVSEIRPFATSTKGWSSSWFLSLVDLGAVAAFRFSNETAEQVPTIQLGDIFSPGLFWSLGFPRSPLSVNIGAQVGPNLRKVTVDTNDYSRNTYIRYSLSTCVDIPVANLYTKSK